MIAHLAFGLIFPGANLVQAPLCVPPEEPWVPDSEADFRTYIDLVAADFERYFSALICLGAFCQDGSHTLAGGTRREDFASRAKALGLRDKLGAEPPAQPERLNGATMFLEDPSAERHKIRKTDTIAAGLTGFFCLLLTLAEICLSVSLRLLGLDVFLAGCPVFRVGVLSASALGSTAADQPIIAPLAFPAPSYPGERE